MMRMRCTWKLIGLIVTGGVLLQGIGCIPAISQVLIEDLANVLITQAVFRAVGAPLAF